MSKELILAPEIKMEVDVILEEANKYEITDQESYEYCISINSTIKSLEKKVEEYFRPTIQKAYEAHQEALKIMNIQLKPLKEARNIINSKILAWRQRQEAIRREQEMILQQKARKEEEERLLRLAEQTGDTSLLEGPIIVPEVIIEDKTKVEGVTFVKTWDFRIVNFTILPDEYKIADEKKIRKVVNALKDQTKIPGVEVFCKESVRLQKTK